MGKKWFILPIPHACASKVCIPRIILIDWSMIWLILSDVMDFLHKCSIFAHADFLENEHLLPITLPVSIDNRNSSFITIRLTDPSIGENPNVKGVAIDLISKITAGRTQSAYLSNLCEGKVAPKTHLAQRPEDFVTPSPNKIHSLKVHYPEVVTKYLSEIHETSQKFIKEFLVYLNWRYNFRMTSGSAEPAFSHLSFVEPTKFYPYPSDGFYPVYISKSKLDVSRFTSEEFDYFKSNMFCKRLHFALLADCINNEFLESDYSLVSAVTALEVGVKEYFFENNPNLLDLYSESQFPPMDKVLSTVFPKIFPSLNEAKFEYDMFIKEIKIIVKARNNLIHNGFATINHLKVPYFLQVIKSLLMIFEYLSGSIWAEEQIYTIKTLKLLHLKGT